ALRPCAPQPAPHPGLGEPPSLVTFDFKRPHPVAEAVLAESEPQDSFSALVTRPRAETAKPKTLSPFPPLNRLIVVATANTTNSDGSMNCARLHFLSSSTSWRRQFPWAATFTSRYAS